MFPKIGSVLLVVGVLTCASTARGDEAEDKAVKVIESAGGKAIRDPARSGKPVVAVVMPPKFGDPELKSLASFKNLLALTLAGPSVTDAAMKEVAELKTLVQLIVDAKALTDSGVKPLAELKNLKQLVLSDANAITAASLSEFWVLKGLNQFAFLGSRVTDEELRAFAGMKKLTALN